MTSEQQKSRLVAVGGIPLIILFGYGISFRHLVDRDGGMPTDPHELMPPIWFIVQFLVFFLFMAVREWRLAFAPESRRVAAMSAMWLAGWPVTSILVLLGLTVMGLSGAEFRDQVELAILCAVACVGGVTIYASVYWLARRVDRR